MAKPREGGSFYFRNSLVGRASGTWKVTILRTVSCWVSVQYHFDTVSNEISAIKVCYGVAKFLGFTIVTLLRCAFHKIGYCSNYGCCGCTVAACVAASRI